MTFSKMDPDAKSRWLVALRSGNYNQRKGVLRDTEDNFCCFGVLCETEGAKISGIMDGSRFSYYEYKFEDGIGSGQIPLTLRNKLKIDFNTALKLIALNDEYGYDFNQIADWIEENL